MIARRFCRASLKELIMSKFTVGKHPAGAGATRGTNDPKTSDRSRVNKAGSAAQFRKNVAHTKAANIWDSNSVQQGPMRGGIRL